MTQNDVKVIAKNMQSEEGQNALCVAATSQRLMDIAEQNDIAKENVYDALGEAKHMHKDKFKVNSLP